MGCGASQEQATQEEGKLEPQFRPKRLNFYYQEYRRQLVESIFASFTGLRQGAKPESLLIEAVPPSRRGSITPTTLTSHTILQHLHFPALLMSGRETKEFNESEEVQHYTKKTVLAPDLIDIELTKPPDSLLVETSENHISIIPSSPAPLMSPAMRYTFDDDDELTEDELFAQMTFQAAPSKAPSSVASSTVRQRRQHQYSANRKTDDIDEAVGYENAGYIATEPTADRLDERMNKGLAKAMLNGITGDVADSTCLRYGKERDDVEATAVPFSLTAPSDTASNDGMDDLAATVAAKTKHLIAGPLVNHALTAHHFVASVGEAVDMVPELGESALRMGSQEIEGLARIDEVRTEQQQNHVASTQCWSRNEAIIRRVYLYGCETEAESSIKKELLLSGVLEVGSSESRDFVSKKWAANIVPWLIEQYRAAPSGSDDPLIEMNPLGESTGTQEHSAAGLSVTSGRANGSKSTSSM